jgi:tetratricopeptide (TPR) repeat protein
MQIAVYAVASHGDQHLIEDWKTNVADADYRQVIDLGRVFATDLATLEHVPWYGERRDDALNAALSMLPPTIDVSIRVDLNERLNVKWRDAVQRAWQPKRTTMLHHDYYWGQHRYVGDRIHRRDLYRWRGRAHERLHWSDRDIPFAHYAPGIIIHHMPRQQPPQFALPHLQADAEEWPNDPDIALVYGRELLYQQRYGEAFKQLQRFLAMASSGPRAAYAYRLLAQVDRENALSYLNQAEFAYSCPSNYLAMAEYYHYIKVWRLCYSCAQFAFSMQRSTPSHIPPEWGDDPRLHTSLLHQLASVAAFHLSDFESAYGHAVEAVRREPASLPLRHHLARMEAKIRSGATAPSKRPVLKVILPTESAS